MEGPDKGRHWFMYLSPVMDVFSGIIVGHDMSDGHIK
jgi:transposase InsO family protein